MSSTDLVSTKSGLKVVFTVLHSLFAAYGLLILITFLAVETGIARDPDGFLFFLLAFSIIFLSLTSTGYVVAVLISVLHNRLTFTNVMMLTLSLVILIEQFYELRIVIAGTRVDLFYPIAISIGLLVPGVALFKWLRRP